MRMKDPRLRHISNAVAPFGQPRGNQHVLVENRPFHKAARLIVRIPPVDSAYVGAEPGFYTEPRQISLRLFAAHGRIIKQPCILLDKARIERRALPGIRSPAVLLLNCPEQPLQQIIVRRHCVLRHHYKIVCTAQFYGKSARTAVIKFLPAHRNKPNLHLLFSVQPLPAHQPPQTLRQGGAGTALRLGIHQNNAVRLYRLR